MKSDASSNLFAPHKDFLPAFNPSQTLLVNATWTTNRLNLVRVYIFHQCSDLSLESSPTWLLTCSLVYPQFIMLLSQLFGPL